MSAFRLPCVLVGLKFMSVRRLPRVLAGLKLTLQGPNKPCEQCFKAGGRAAIQTSTTTRWHELLAPHCHEMLR